MADDDKTLIDEIIAGMNNLKTLEIRTYVGNWTWDETNKRISPEATAKGIMTQINLVGGDITTASSEEFLKPPLDTIREFHKEREKEGYAIIEKNLQTLKDLMQFVIDAFNRKEEADKKKPKPTVP